MRFLADESCDASVTRVLRSHGHDVKTVAETIPGSPDQTVLEMALSERRVLLTEDKDFGCQARTGLTELLHRHRALAGPDIGVADRLRSGAQRVAPGCWNRSSTAERSVPYLSERDSRGEESRCGTRPSLSKVKRASAPTLPICPGALLPVLRVMRSSDLIQEAIEFHIEGLKEAGDPIPEPTSSIEFVEVAPRKG
jgi:hypothetical protein